MIKLIILDGKKLKEELLDTYKEKIIKENIQASLAVILVGDNEASKIYIKNKEKTCKKIGIDFKLYHLEENTEEKEVQELIRKLNQDESVTGIILQSPVPQKINFDACSSLIDPLKDVDGFTKENIYKLYLNEETLMPCTVLGIITLLKNYQINLDGLNALIIGRGNIVGHPLSLALLNENATVTVAHSHTKNLKDLCLKSDLIIAATGKVNLITEDMVKKDSIVVDVGVSRIDGHIKGDVDFQNVQKKCAYITPNPGGVGPMTVAMIMHNVLKAYEMQKGEKKNG